MTESSCVPIGLRSLAHGRLAPRALRGIAALAAVAVLVGCSSLLPSSSSEASSFESFDAARAALEALVPMQSTRTAVEQAGLIGTNQINTKSLRHPDIVRLLVPTGLLKREDLDPGILVCLEAREACQGLDIQAFKIAKKRTGNFWTDFIGFRQRTETTGWRFNALILFVNDKVVYRAWNGQPKVEEVEVVSRPLGPFQDVGPSVVSGAAK